MPDPGRRHLLSHPAVGAFVAVWLAALFGLIVFVLPDAIMLDIAAAGPAASSLLAIRLFASIVAAAVGAGLGISLVRLLRRRARDPRPTFRDEDLEHAFAAEEAEQSVRRPLSVRDELDADLDEEPMQAPAQILADEWVPDTPQPPVPPVPAEAIRRAAREIDPDAGIPDLLAEFDRALDGVRGQGSTLASPAQDSQTDPVRVFLARQGAGSVPPPHTEPPDNQRELRIVLDKLARVRTANGTEET